FKVGDGCEYSTSFDACNQAFDRAKTDLEHAASIVRRLGYVGLVQQTDQLLQNIVERRALIQSQQSKHLAIANAPIFQPKKAGDVLVTDSFITGRQEIPPTLLAEVRAQTQLQQQLRRLLPLTEQREAQ